MRTIFKYNIPLADQFELNIPSGSTILKFGLQRDEMVMWVEVDTERYGNIRTFAIVGTGNPVPDNANKYIGTVQQGSFVWHLYECV